MQTKTEKTKELLLKEIQQGKYKNRIPSYKSLMNKFNVSQATIFAVLNSLEKEGLIIKKNRQGIFVNQPKNFEGNVTLIVPRSKGVLFSQTIRLTHDILAEKRFRNIVSILSDDPAHEAEVLRGCIDDGSKGILFMPFHESPDSAKALQQLLENKPVIQIDRHYSSVRCDYVSIDHFNIIKAITEYAMNKGNQKIAYLTSERPLRVLSSCEDRLRGYKAAMEYRQEPFIIEAGITFSEDYHTVHIKDEHLDLITNNYFDTIIVENATLAKSLIQVINSKKTGASQNINILTIDTDEVMSNIAPGIKHFPYQYKHIIKRSVDLLCSRIKDGKPQDNIYENILIMPPLSEM